MNTQPTMKMLLPLLFTTATASSCSCSPTSYTFRLNLSQDCSTNDIKNNPGITESLCFVESDVSLPTGKRVKSMVDRSGGPFGSSWGQNFTTSSTVATPAAEGEEVRRSLQDSMVDEVVSVQYLEFDTSDTLNVIYSDDEHIDTSLSDGDLFTFYSSSEGGAEEEIGGASLILYGVDGDGVVVRNRFFWKYDDCEASLEGVKVGDSIGWVTVEEITGPNPEDCPAVPQPTPSPMGNVEWLTPYPTPTEAEGTPSPTIPGSDGTNGTITDSTEAPVGYSSKTNKPYYPSSKASNDVFNGGKTQKHPYDNWSYDGGQIPSGKSSKAYSKAGKSSKNSKNGKAFGKSLKGGNRYQDNYRMARLFSEAVHNGENIR